VHLLRLRGHKGVAAILGFHVVAGERNEGRHHVQPVFPREIEVALVVRRTAEDRAGAVVHQDEVGDVDRQFPRRVERVAAGQAGVEPSFSAFSIASSVVPPRRASAQKAATLGSWASSSLASG
jgi:hypothetical protein